MDHPAGVGGRQGPGDPLSQGQDLAEGQTFGVALEQVCQALASDELHGQVVLAIGLPGIQDGHHPGMPHPGSGLRLLTKPQGALGSFLKVLGQDLQGDLDPRAGIPRQVDHTHATSAQFSEDLVGPKLHQNPSLRPIHQPRGGSNPRHTQVGICSLGRGADSSKSSGRLNIP